MSFREHIMYSVICDYSGCSADAQEGGDFVAWVDKDQALSDATGSGDWEVFAGEHLCGTHWHWCEKADDEAKPGPADGCCMFKGAIFVDVPCD